VEFFPTIRKILTSNIILYFHKKIIIEKDKKLETERQKDRTERQIERKTDRKKDR
jgi:hypothetical protein